MYTPYKLSQKCFNSTVLQDMHDHNNYHSIQMEMIKLSGITTAEFNC